jgi:hypothetical protein
LAAVSGSPFHFLCLYIWCILLLFVSVQVWTRFLSCANFVGCLVNGIQSFGVLLTWLVGFLYLESRSHLFEKVCQKLTRVCFIYFFYFFLRVQCWRSLWCHCTRFYYTLVNLSWLVLEMK